MTADSKFFLDSNIWFYSFSDQDVGRSLLAKNLINENRPKISVSTQIINEVCVNLKRKSAFTESDVGNLIHSFYREYEVIELNRDILLTASDIRRRFNFNFWDGLVVASALSAEAAILYSEDMQDGFVLDNKLKIVNPFNS